MRCELQCSRMQVLQVQVSNEGLLKYLLVHVHVQYTSELLSNASR